MEVETIDMVRRWFNATGTKEEGVLSRQHWADITRDFRAQGIKVPRYNEEISSRFSIRDELSQEQIDFVRSKYFPGVDPDEFEMAIREIDRPKVKNPVTGKYVEQYLQKNADPQMLQEIERSQLFSRKDNLYQQARELDALTHAIGKLEEFAPGLILNGWYYAPEMKTNF